MAAAKRKVVLAYPWTEVRRGEDGRRIEPREHKAGATVSVDDVTARALVRDGKGQWAQEDPGAPAAGDGTSTKGGRS